MIIADEFLGCYWSPKNLKALRKVLISGLASLKKETLDGDEKALIGASVEHLDKRIEKYKDVTE